MESARLATDTRNIPHMQLFHYLKQKFPDLRDNDVNESIQKYGLDRERCEEELSQKNQIHHGGYYGPWGRPSSGVSSPTVSRVTSPIRTGIPSTPTTPVITTTSASIPLHQTTATHHIFGPLQSSGYLVYSYGPGMVTTGPEPVYTSACPPPVTTSPVYYQPVVNNIPNFGWHPSVSNGFRAAGVQPPRPGVLGYNVEETPISSRDTSKSRSSTPVPNSAPVLPNFDPFSDFESRPERRRSAETDFDTNKGLYYNRQNFENYERFSNSPHSPTPPMNSSGINSPATSTTTTTTFTNTRSVGRDQINVNGGNISRPPPAIVQEQSLRKQKLETELAKQAEEKGRLQSEVELMQRELKVREDQRKRNADANAQKIQEVQRENQRLQLECDEMENKILRLAPDFGQDDYPALSPSQAYGHETPSAAHLPRVSSGSSLGSGSGTPQTPLTPQTPYTAHVPGIFIPQRPAPPPPPPSMHNHNYRGFQGIHGDTVEEMGPKWACTKCTFINHPDMNKCEMCECPRFNIGSQEYPGWTMV
ncbi:hypothetical protein SK128_026966 [Halocaridina rubra]|uniref:RanBP2-type domain-containing protein n=1 Tax=Halocaridina rubra TaxID=373956 RepID=A0AAN8X8W8_HALRR